MELVADMIGSDRNKETTKEDCDMRKACSAPISNDNEQVAETKNMNSDVYCVDDKVKDYDDENGDDANDRDTGDCGAT